MRNPIAPPGVQGVPAGAPEGYVDLAFSYVYAISLSANDTLLAQVVTILNDADFFLRGIVFTSTAGFSVRFQDGNQYYLSSDFVLSTNIPNSPGNPYPVMPEVYYPAGGKIVLDIQDTSGSTNTGQIQFLGVNRYLLK